MTSAPHIFDQEVVARPCRSGCVAHAHVAHLPSYAENHYGEPEDNVPAGWTAQSGSLGFDDGLMWFQCNLCDAVVSELEVEHHVCELK